MFPNQAQFGTVHGTAIQLDQLSGLDDGTKVLVYFQPVKTAKQPGDGFRAAAGAWADIPGLDEDLAEIMADRKRDTRTEL
jgi:hypothetical protein